MDELGRCIEEHRARLQATEDADAAQAGRTPTRMSNRELGRRADIHWSTITAFIDGQVGRPEQLGALARALADHNVTPDAVLADLQRAAGLPVGAGFEWKLPGDYLMMPARTRAAFEAMIRAVGDDLLAAHGLRRDRGKVLRRQDHKPDDDGQVDADGQADGR